MMDEAVTEDTHCSPVDVPIDPVRFWSTTRDLSEIGPVPETETTPALRRLGPPPFARSRFPLMGFLATVYEHISTHIREHSK